MKKSMYVLSGILTVSFLITSGCSSLGSGKDKAAAKTAASSAPASTAASTAPASTAAKKAEYVLKLGYGQTTTNPRHLTAVKFAAWVNEKTNGRVQIDLFPGEILGTDKQMTEQTAMGSLDMCVTAPGVIASYAPIMAAIELPFLFSSAEKIGPVLDGPLGDEMAKDLPAKGLRNLGYWENGLRHITNNKRPIEKPEDFKGVKIRAPENKMTISIFKALGANPSPLAFPEVYLALSQGVFDGQENPITNIHSAKFYEVQKYMSITNHKYEALPLLISEAVWKKLPADIQKVLSEGGVLFAKEHRKMVTEMEAKLLDEMVKAGIKVSKPDMKPFIAATQPVYTEWEGTLGKDFIASMVKAAQ